MEASAPLTLQAELAFGENAEVRIIRRWTAKSKAVKKGHSLVKSPSYATLDFLVLDNQAVPVAWLEVKRRRTGLLKYGDAICPWKKHLAAKKLAGRFDVPVLLITEYGCGSLIEVNLATQPARKLDVTRRDRAGSKPVPHALYTLDQLTVLERES